MSFQSGKRALSSLTIVASCVGVIVSLLSSFGIHIAPDVVPNLNAVITGACAATAIYGRIRANTFIL
jgi:uncharacterized membrane protein (DUF441 family)